MPAGARRSIFELRRRPPRSQWLRLSQLCALYLRVLPAAASSCQRGPGWLWLWLPPPPPHWPHEVWIWDLGVGSRPLGVGSWELGVHKNWRLAS
jgi:hypothetical protein